MRLNDAQAAQASQQVKVHKSSGRLRTTASASVTSVTIVEYCALSPTDATPQTTPTSTSSQKCCRVRPTTSPQTHDTASIPAHTLQRPTRSPR